MKKNKTYIIAEAGVNHNGSLAMAKELIDVAKDAGADAVKFQTFISEKVISKFAAKAEYQLSATGSAESQLEMVKKLELDAAAHYELLDRCRTRGIEFLSTPFDLESVDLLVREMNLPRIKIPSGEITNAPYLLKIAQSQKLVLLSTGMSTLSDIELALSALAFGYLHKKENPSRENFYQTYFTDEGQNVLRDKVTLLHCTTEYPTPFSDVNLRVIQTLSGAFGLPVGYSDHTVGIAVPIAAAALGAAVIEKHFTLDKSLSGPDHAASLEPRELADMVAGIRQIEQALGSGKKIPAASEIKNMSIARKSLVAAQNIRQGEPYTTDNITIKRPGNGMSPFSYWDILDKKANRDYVEDEVIDWDVC